MFTLVIAVVSLTVYFCKITFFLTFISFLFQIDYMWVDEIDSQPSTSKSASTSSIATLPSPSPTSASTSKPEVPGRKTKFQDGVMKEVQRVSSQIDIQLQRIEEMDNKMYELEVKKTQILEKIANKHCAVMDSILDYVAKST